MENPLKLHIALTVGVRHQRLKSLKMHQLVSLECLLECFIASFRVSYLRYSMPRMTSLKYNLACSSDKGLSVGTSITGLKIMQAVRKTDAHSEADKSTDQLFHYLYRTLIPNVKTFKHLRRHKHPDQTSLILIVCDEDHLCLHRIDPEPYSTILVSVWMSVQDINKSLTHCSIRLLQRLLE